MDVQFKYDMANLENLRVVTQQKFRNIIYRGTEMIARTATEFSPVETGTNRRSIDYEVMRESGGNWVGKIFTGSGYGGYLEKNTKLRRRTPFQQKHHLKGTGRPTPYIIPAFMARKGAIEAMIVAARNE